MPLDPEIEIVLGLVEKAGYPEFCDLTPVKARELFEQTAPVLDAGWEDVRRVEDREIATPDGDVALRIYKPSDDQGPLPVVLFYHGGGFVIGSIESYDKICRVLANRIGAIVVSVDYRLAPEHPFPAAVEDAIGALEWVVGNADQFGGDAGRIAVVGDSAGGNLAAVVAQAGRDKGINLVCQALIYPAVGGTPETASHQEFADGYLLTKRNIDWFYGHYLPDDTDPRDPRFAPLLAADLKNLAPSLIIVAGYDPLRDEGIEYARKLMAAGNEVTLSNYAGMVHGFFSLSGAVGDGRRAIGQVANTLQQVFQR